MFGGSSGGGCTSETTDLSGPKRLKVDARKVNESLYELRRPSGTPEMELVFFHGLQSEDESDAHLRTWESEDGSSLWPQSWLAEEFPAARILCVAYDGSVRNSSRSSFDMHNIIENLITDFMQGKIGQTPNCPVVLIGHCFGGLVIKQLCVEANIRKHAGWESQRAKVGAFLNNVKGVVFYSTPHHGIAGLGEASELVKNNQLLGFFETLSNGASKLDFEFTQLRQVYATWLVGSLEENLPADQGTLRDVVAAPEGTARTRDDFNLLAVDHWSICKPQNKNDKRFYFLTELLDMIARKSQVVLPIHEVHGLPTYPLDLERRALVVKEKLIGGGILGICGMGGIGKTTLAMQIFNTISKDFEYTCFVHNVKGIPSDDLENWVLDQFHHNGKKSVPGSTQWLDLQTKKTLIAMDDVDRENQLRVLRRLEHFGAGSCIIITSRNREVFKYHEGCIVHEVDLLEEHDAKRLLCRHAFGSQDFPEFLTDKVDAVVNKCDGLPLTLEVIGKYLQDHSTDVEAWTETLHRLTEAQAITGEKNDKVWASLRISYDALLPEEQEIFTVAALFFFQNPLDDALAAWSTATRTIRITWRNLVSRSLVKEINKRVWVHEHLRDLAHNISKEIMVSGTDDTADSAVDLLNDKQVEATTKCLRIEYDHDDRKTRRTLHLESLAKLKGLKYMDLSGVYSEGSGTGVTTKISYLRFHSLYMSTFKFSLNKMQNLFVLELSNFRIPKEFPDALGTLTNLHILRLCKLEGFDHLPESFGNLSRVRRLEVRNLSSFTLLKSIGNLRALEHLVLHNIGYLTLPESLGDLSKLILDDFVEWTGLESLCISSEELDTLPLSPFLERLPESLGSLHHLRELILMNPRKLKMLPENFGRLVALQELRIDGAHELQTLPHNFSHLESLQKLSLSCATLERLPENFGNLSSLQELCIESSRMERLPETFGNLSSLQELAIESSSMDSLPESFGRLQHLRVLILINPKKLKMLPENFGGLVALQHLCIYGADELQTLPDSFSGLESLQELTLHCPTLEKLPEKFGNLSSLLKLSIESSSMDSLPESFGGLHHLRALTLRNLQKLKMLPENFGDLIALQDLQILGADELQTLPDSFSNLESLRELTLYCPTLERLPKKFGNLSSLRELSILSRNIASLLESIQQLHSLELIITGDYTCNLPGSLGGLSSLRALTLTCLPLLETLPDELGTLSALERLTIEHCCGLKSLPDSLGQLSSLQEVSLVGCDSLEILPESWGLSGGIEGASPEGSQRGECLAQGEESEETEPLLLRVNACPFLDESRMESLGWTFAGSDWYSIVYEKNF